MTRLLKPTVLLPLYRALVLVGLVVLIHEQARWIENQAAPAVSLRQAGRFFPEARRIEMRDAKRGLYLVTDSLGETLGGLLVTSPWTDHVIGYSGPNNLLVALDLHGAILGLELLESGDTPEHVEKVRRAPEFLSRFLGWNPAQEPPPRVEAVSGATLTSFAVVEGLQQRLLGSAPSLRFPEAITLEEARTLFPEAARFEPEASGPRVLDASNHLLGYVLRTSPQADNVSGYRGPTECLVGLDPDGRTLKDLRLRQSYDTPSYVDQVRQAQTFFRLFQNRTVEELAALEYPKSKVEGISGATRTARAVVEGLHRRLAAELEARKPVPAWRPRFRDGALTGVIVAGLVLAFTPLRGRRWVRLLWQLLLIGYVGLVNHDLLSLSLFAGWASHGLALKAAPGLVLLTAGALFVPWGTRRQFYCHQVCPHGAAQQLLGKLFRRRRTLPPGLARALEFLPSLLLAVALLGVLAGWAFNFAAIEPFDAWNWKTAGTATVVIAVAGLAASLFVPQAYCRFGCPTGAILSFVRSSGSAARWGRRDWTALAFLGAGLAAVVAVRSGPQTPSPPEPSVLRGQTMGTTWTVKIRDELASPPVLEQAVAKEFDWAESLTSHRRTNTDLSLFNRTHDTNAMAVPWPVLTLGRWAGEISRATGGAYDVTAGPLVRLWGFGPGPRRNEPPADAEIAAARASVGWEKRELLDGMIRKRAPGLEVDLSSIAHGWAIDKVTDLLVFRGYTNFLVKAGGELRAVGPWNVAVERPARSCFLRDESMASSGIYRLSEQAETQPYSHLIDPRTGRPVTHQTVAVSVRHEDCGHAEAWATALNVLGIEEGWPLAERLHLAAEFVVEHADGKLDVQSTSAWRNRETLARTPPAPPPANPAPSP
jgi:thiamine biosynthesis lipoprotein ApbE/Na+-translocating ferredoxin:NAD+ oxidoreductase RnfG subunit